MDPLLSHVSSLWTQCSFYFLLLLFHWIIVRLKAPSLGTIALATVSVMMRLVTKHLVRKFWICHFNGKQ